MFKAESTKQNHLEGGGPPVVRSVRQPRVSSGNGGQKGFDEYRKKVDRLAEDSRELLDTWERTRGTLDYSVNDNLEDLALNIARQRLAVRVATWSEEDYVTITGFEETSNTRGRSRMRELRSLSPLPADDVYGVRTPGDNKRPSGRGVPVEERESVTTIDATPAWMENALAEGAPVLTGFDLKAALASKDIWEVKEKLYEVHDLAAQQEMTLDDLFQEMTRMMDNNHRLANKLIDREKELETIKEAFLIATEGHGDASTVINGGTLAITNGDDAITNSDDDTAHASASEASGSAAADPHSHVEPVSTGRTPPMGPRAPLPVSVSEARRDCYRRYSGLDVGVEDVAARAGESERQGEDMENGGQTQERTQGMPTVDEKAGGDEVSLSQVHMPPAPANGGVIATGPVKDDAEARDTEVAATAATPPPLFATPLPHPGQFMSSRFRAPKSTSASVDGRALRSTKSTGPFGEGPSNPFGADGGQNSSNSSTNGDGIRENEGIAAEAVNVAEHHAAEVDEPAAGNRSEDVSLLKENGKGVAVDDGVSSCTSYGESIVSYRSGVIGNGATGNPQTSAGIGNGDDACGEDRIGVDGTALGGEGKIGGETKGFFDEAVGGIEDTNGVPNGERTYYGGDSLWAGVQGTCEDYFDGGGV